MKKVTLTKVMITVFSLQNELINPKSFLIKQLSIIVLLVIAACCAETLNAQTFPYSETFKNSTAVGMEFGGSPNPAILTAASGLDANGAGYLRLTAALNNQAGYARNILSFPSNRGLSITFEYYTFGGSGADGLSFFLYDATASPFNIGAAGGSLGYAQHTSSPGVSKGYLGIGLDEFGNFSNPTLGRMLGPGFRPSSVAIRGDGNGVGGGGGTNYEYIAGIQTTNAAAMIAAGAGTAFNIAGGTNGRTGGGLLPTSFGYRHARIDLDVISGGYKINVYITEGIGIASAVHHVISDYNYTTGVLPANLSYGFAASTGSANNFHEIRSMNIVIPHSVAVAPVAVADSKTTLENTPVTFSLTDNDYDENGSFTLNIASGVDLDPLAGGIQIDNTVPGSGTFHYNGNGTVTFTPVTNFFGDVPTIHYTIQDDGNGGVVAVSTSNSAPINVTVTEVSGITLTSTNAIICVGSTSTGIPYTATKGSPNQYRINFNATAEAQGFADINLTSLPAGSIPVVVPSGAAAGAYNATLFVRNSGSGIESVGTPITITLNTVPLAPAISLGGPGTFCEGGSLTLTSSAPSGNQWYKNAVLMGGETATILVVTTSGVYTVTTNNEGPCTSAASAGTTVTVNSSPQPGSITGLTTPCAGLSGVTYSVPNIAGTTYNWSYSGSGATITGNGSSSITIAYLRSSTSGTLSVTATNASACPSIPASLVITMGAACNIAPVAMNDAPTTPEDTPVTFSVAANDTDTDGTIDITSLDLDPLTAGTQTTFTVSGQGTYTANSNGTVSFTPVLNYNGTTTPVNYTVKDNDGLVSNSAGIIIVVSPVNDPPVAVNDSPTTPEDTPLTFSVAANDTDVDGTIDIATIDLDPLAAGIQTTFTVIAQGTYTANNTGTVTFTPVLNFNGTATPVNYTIKDNAGLVSNVAIIAITVSPVNDAPIAVDDVIIALENTPVTFSATFNDTDVDGTIDVTSIDLDPLTAGTQTTFTVSGQGTYTAASDGTVTFTPVINYNGTATPVNYTVKDNTGLVSNTAIIAITVAAVNGAPVALNNTAATPEDTPVTFNVTANDTDSDGTIDVTSIDLDPLTAGTQITFTVSGQGTYTANSNGTVTFTPVLNYNGPATAVNYTVKDNNGLVSNAAPITVSISPVNDAPVAVNDAPSTPEDTPVTFSVAANDTDVDGTIDITSIDLDPLTAGTQTTFTVSGQGTYTANSNGTVSFTPVLNYTGTTTPVNYTVKDNAGLVSNAATITTIITPVNDPPVAVSDVVTTPEDTPVTFSVAANDTDTDGTINITSIDLDPLTAGTQTTFTVTGQGTYTANAAGTVTFIPVLNFNGTAIPVNYTVKDNSGLVSNTATITVTLTPVNDAPVAVNNTRSTPEDTPLTFSVTNNDTDVDGTINVATVDLDPLTAGTQTSFTVSGQGTYVANSTGTVTFTPVLNFNGTAIPVNYTVKDNTGLVSNVAIISLTVTPVNDAPVAVNDVTITLENTPVTFSLTLNDTDVDGTIDVTSIDLDPLTAGTQTTFTVSGQGTYTANGNGTVTFTPVPNYNGNTTPVNYTVKDNLGLVSNAAINISITVAAVNGAPVALNDIPTTPEDTPVTFSVTANDLDGDGTIDITSLDLDPLAAGTQTTFTVSGQGTYTANSNGTVSFTPVLNYNGTTTPVNYTVKDNDGLVSNSAGIIIVVSPVNDPPVAVNDSPTTPEDTPLTFSVAANDTDVDGTIDIATIDLDPLTAGIQTTFTVIAQGTYTANNTGTVTFTPVLNFNGTATPVNYTIKDNAGLVSNVAIIAITVSPVNDAPIAVDDVIIALENTPVTFSATFNDTDVDGTIDVTSIDLDPLTAGTQTTFTVSGQGTYTAASDGTVTFTPVINYNGTATPVNYTVKDNTGLVSNTAIIAITVAAVNGAPVALNNTAATPEDTPVTFNVTANDTDSDGTIDVTSIDLDPLTAGTQITFTVSGQGTYTANSNGTVTFTPVLNYNGPATAVNYTVKDNNGLVSNAAPITVSISPVNDAPVAVNDAPSTPEDTPVTFSVAANDTDVDGTIDITSIDLDPLTAGTQTTFTVSGQGTYTANSNGTVSFTPVLNYTGTTTPVNYTVKDNAGLVSNAATITTIITPVNDPPVAVSDVVTTPEDTPVTFSVAANDTDTDGTINITSIDLDPLTAGTQTTFTVTGQGTYTANAAGTVTFIPVLNFNGTAIPVNYTVKDNSGLVSNTATITVTLTPVNDAPVAVNNTRSTPEDTPLTFSVTNNDTDVDGTINVATVDLDPLTAGTQTSFTVSGQGTYVANSTGTVTFTPVLNFNGTAIPVNYTVKDNTGLVSNVAIISLTVTPVNDAPVAVNDVTITLENTPVTFSLTLNDTDVDGTIDVTSIDLDPLTAGTQTTFTVSGQGTYTANGNGTVTFTPVPNYNGNTTPVNYTVKDNLGLVSNAAINISITVAAVNGAPVALNDIPTTPEDTPVTFSVTANDLDGDGTIDITSLDLDPLAAGTQTTFTVSGQGTYTANSNGTVSFTPVLNYNGTTTPVNYTVKDNDGLVSNSAGIIIVVSPVNDPPVAVNDSPTTPEDTPLTFSVAANDTDVDGTIDIATIDLDPLTAGIQTTFTVIAQGTYTANNTGTVTFTPVLNFNGTATPVNYTIKDNAGLVSNVAIIAITVSPVNDAPIAVDDVIIALENTPVTFSATFNDTDVDGTIDVTSIDLDPLTAGTQTTFTVSGQGTYTAASDGTVTFTPVINYNGTATPVNYTVKDNTGLVSNTAIIAITVAAVNGAPVALNNTAATPEDTPVTFNVTANDTDSDGTIDVTSIDLDPLTAGTQITFTVSGQGTYTANSNGTVTFTPVLNYNGPATAVNYTVKDNNGLVSNAAPITVSISPVNDAPVAVNDAPSTPEDTPVTFSVAANDTDVDGTIDITSIDLDPLTAGTQTTFTVSGQGTYTANSNGTVSFTPVLNYTGTTTPVNYTVKDNAGLVSNAATITTIITPVNDPPVAVSDVVTTPEDTPVTFSVAANDTDTDGTINITSIDLDPLTAGTQTTFTVTGQGTYTANAAGTVTFIPVLNFNGTAIPVNYTVKDNSGLVSNTATITVTLTPVNDAPVAVNNTRSTPEDTPLTFSVTNNDTDVDGTINVATVDLDPLTAGTQTSFTVSGQGTYVANSTGTVTFTPVLNFNGTAIPVNYTVKDNTGLVSNVAIISLTVTPVNDAPVAVNDVAIALEDTPVTFSVTINDTDVDGTIDVTSIDLDPLTAGTQTTITVSGQGTYTANSNGTVTFTPVSNFNGTATSVNYTVKDNTGLVSNMTTITLTVTSINDAPVALNDAATTPEDAPVTFSVTANDFKVDGSIDVTSIDLDPLTSGTQTTFTVSGQGTYTASSIGTVSFSPVLNYNGTTTPVSYTVKGNLGSTSNVATITIIVTPVNDAPVAVNDAPATPEDTPVTFSVAANDTDADGTIDIATIDLDPLTAGTQTTFTVIAQGTYTANNTGTVSFAPVLNFTGTATPINYTIKDNSGLVSNVGIIAITVSPLNDAPIAVNDAIITLKNTPVTFSVTTNDTDVDGTIDITSIDLDPLAAGIWTTFTVSGQGTYTANSNGTVTFTPVLDYNGIATPINYTVKDNTGLVSNTTIITITVTDVNGAPVALNDAASTTEDTPVTFSLTANDTDSDGTIDVTSIDLDPLTAGTQTTFTVSGQGTYTANSNGTVTFTPVLNYNGPATPITYTVKDNDGLESNEAPVTIIVSPVNDAPVAVIDAPATPEDTPVTFSVAANDTDVDGTIDITSIDLDPLAAGTQAAFTVTGQGTYTTNSTGTVTFAPVLNYNGTATPINYTVKDNSGLLSNAATIAITVTPVNDPPVAVNDVATTAEDTPVTFSVTANDTDTDGTIDITSIDLNLMIADTQTRQGIYSSNSNGTVTFTPALNFNGTTAPINYTVKDNSGLVSNIAIITITVIPVNDAPVVANISKISTGFNPVPITITDFTSKFIDVDGNPLTKIRMTSLPATGILKLNGLNVTAGQEISLAELGNLTYTPVLFSSGVVSFLWNGNDGTVYATNNANVTITITLPPDPAKIGVAKKLASVTNGLNGSYDVKFTFTVINYGVNTLDNISLVDNLALTFAGTNFMVKSVNNSGNLRINTAYNGVGITELLLPSSRLLAGEIATVELVVNIKLLSKDGTFLNTALATGTSPINGLKVTDMSTDGVKPDPIVAGDVSSAVFTPIPLAFKPVYIPGGFSPNNDGINDVFVIQNVVNKLVTIRIYNRWANLVYKSNAYKDDWDGKCTEGIAVGQDVPDGTYFYILVIDNKDKYQGFITINR